jgi:hypothetical protein
MMLTPREGHISVMLNELQALCYSRAMQDTDDRPCVVTADQLDNYKNEIMAKIVELRQQPEDIALSPNVAAFVRHLHHWNLKEVQDMFGKLSPDALSAMLRDPVLDREGLYDDIAKELDFSAASTSRTRAAATAALAGRDRL